MARIQFMVRGDKATAEEMAEVNKLRLAGNFVRFVRDEGDLWPGWETRSLKPKRTRRKKEAEEPIDLIGDIDDN